MLRLLFLGDIIGEPGRRAVVEMLPELKESWKIDFTVVNGQVEFDHGKLTGATAGHFLRGRGWHQSPN